jgi:gamma-glutamyl:cysteine ligase YbdK (ATP-grasp superfamily)
VGIDVERDSFTPEDFREFSQRLHVSLDLLRQVLAREGFGEGPMSFGAELEMFLIDDAGAPLLLNEQILEDAHDDQLTVELNQFNLEFNTTPSSLSESPFSSLGVQLLTRIERLRAIAAQRGARLALVGILPTLQHGHFVPQVITDVPRYRALARLLRARRAGPFELHIDGEEPLRVAHEDVSLEGATTSWQLHLRVPPARFARLYNSAQLATAPALAVAANSPVFLGHRLWQETRVALFKQAVDERTPPERRSHKQPRVSFGTRWLEQGALELFEENVHQFSPVLPVVSSHAPDALDLRLAPPELEELRVHCGTIWRWNRPVYDPAEGGHLRIEMRALPAGPTISDMLSNAAFMVGATLACEREIEASVLPFHLAEDNFYRAAQFGLDAELNWPTNTGVRTVSARELVLELVPKAGRALVESGVAAQECRGALSVVAQRAERGQTGARWQSLRLSQLDARLPRDEALRQMLSDYLKHSERGEPVHLWPL